VAHGGGNRKPCSVEGCSTLAQIRGLCSKHCNTCREDGCIKAAKIGGLCVAHGDAEIAESLLAIRVRRAGERHIN
jgi:hypothetical protein